MRDTDLGTVLLVKAFEDQDSDGTLLPPAERESASREAARGEAGASAGTGVPQEQRLLIARARILFGRVATRHPVVESIRALTGSPRPLFIALAVVGFLAGLALSALDGPRRIEVVLSPALGIFLLWNLVVYTWLFVAWIRRREPHRGWLAGLVARIPRWLALRSIRGTRAFDSVLAGALGKFVREWFDLATPLLVARAKAALHLSAAAAGLGLVTGLAFRGLALEYRAGWETTFLSAEWASRIVGTLHGPAAALGGLALPDARRMDAIRWPAGEPAGPWLVLVMLTVLLYVVLPRLVLFATGAYSAARRREMPLPAALQGYFRASFSHIESVVATAVAIVIPYAHAPTAAALARLIAWIPEHAGGKVRVQATDPVPYGEEERYLATLGERGAAGADLLVMPFSLATTPEDENHGVVIAGVRDWIAASRPAARLLVVIDEAPLRERMAGMPERIAERREAWRAFVEARGEKAVFVDLAP